MKPPISGFEMIVILAMISSILYGWCTPSLQKLEKKVKEKLPFLLGNGELKFDELHALLQDSKVKISKYHLRVVMNWITNEGIVICRTEPVIIRLPGEKPFNSTESIYRLA